MSINELARRLWDRLDLGEFENLVPDGRGEFDYIARVHLSDSRTLSFQDVKDGSSSLIYSEDERSWIGIRETPDGEIQLYHQIAQKLRNKSSERLIASGFIGSLLYGYPVKLFEREEHFLYRMPVPSADVAEEFFLNFIRQGHSAPRSTASRYPCKRQPSK